MKKKLLCILLTVLMVVLLPISAFAVASVESIDITDVAAPVLNGKMNYNFTMPENAGYEMDVYSYDYLSSLWIYTEEMPESYNDINLGDSYYYGNDVRFTKPGYYTFAVDVRSCDGYQIDSNTLANLNGNPANIHIANSWVRVYYTFPYLADIDYTDVTKIDITDVFEPIVGAKARFDFSVSENTGIEIPSVLLRWVESGTIPQNYDDIFQNNIYWDDEKLIFKEGYYYTLIIDINCVLGYEFNSNTVYTINGKTANTYAYDDFSTSIWYTFTPEEIKDVTEITIDGVVSPVVENAPEFEYTIPQRNGYSKATETTSESAWIITNNAPQSKADLDNGNWIFPYMVDETNQVFFEEDCYYTFFTFIQADGGIFNNNLTATINGKNAFIDTSSADYGIIGVYYTFKAEEIKQLASIKINTLSKTEYKYGENFDDSTIVIEGIYNDGSSAGIIDNSLITFKGFDSSTRGTKTIVAEYNGLVAKFNVEIKFTFWNWLLYIVCFGWIWM